MCVCAVGWCGHSTLGTSPFAVFAAGYDPSKYRDSAADDRMMEASAADIAREEARSKRIAKTEDEREAEAEARRAAAKEAKKRKRKGAGSFFDD